MSKVFISYLRSDWDRISPYVAELERRNVPVWIDRQGLEIGQEWPEKVEAEIRSSSAFVLFVSADVTKRQDSFIHNEIQMAAEYISELPRRMTWFFPVRLDADAEFPDVDVEPDRQLSDFQILEARLTANAPVVLANRVADTLADPSQRTAEIIFRCEHVKNNPQVQLDGASIGLKLPRHGIVRTRVPVTSRSLRLHIRWWFEPGIGDHDTTPDWHERSSPDLPLKLSPGETIVVLVKPDGLWGLGENWKLEIVK